jgi:hypothetical protein
VVELKNGLLAVVDLRRRVGRHDDDQIDLALPQPPVGLSRVGDDTLGVDLLAQPGGVILDHRPHRAFVGHDEQRAQGPNLLTIADAEQQQNETAPR